MAISQKMVINESIRIDGANYGNSIEQLFDNKTKLAPLIPRAKTGVLTVRTDNTSGSATLEASHGITTGAKVSIYWYNTNGTLAGARHSVTVGTVAGTTVPITASGSGNNLPLAASAIVMMMESEEDFVRAGDDVKVLFIYSPVAAHVHIMDDAGTPAIIETFTIQPDTVYRWYFDSGQDNPLAGVNVTAARITHGDGVNEQVVEVIFGYN